MCEYTTAERETAMNTKAPTPLIIIAASLLFIFPPVQTASSLSEVNDTSEASQPEPKTAILDIRIGWNWASSGETKGVHLFETINRKFQYHVFSTNGMELFTSTEFKREHPEGCDDYDIRTSWLLIPDSGYTGNVHDKLGGTYSSLVIGTREHKNFTAPTLKKITTLEKKTCMQVILHLDEFDTTNYHFIQFHSAGYLDSTHRIFVEFFKKGAGSTSIAIVDIINGKGTLSYFKEKCSNENYEHLSGMADLDGNGFCETFALNFGDYGGKHLLSRKGGEWFIWSDGGPSPC